MYTIQFVRNGKVREVVTTDVEKALYDKTYGIMKGQTGHLNKLISVNICGMGSGLIQKVNRDTQRFSFKSSAQCNNGEWSVNLKVKS